MLGELPKGIPVGEKTRTLKMLILGQEKMKILLRDMKMIAGIQAQEEDILPEGWKMTEET